MKNSSYVLSITVAALLVPATASAHKPSDSYLTLRPEGEQVGGHWDVALRDLDTALTLDADGDGSLRWAELRVREDEVRAYLSARLGFTRGRAPCALRLDPLAIVQHSDGAYARFPLTATCHGAGPLALSYQLLFDLDAQHRSVVRVGANEAEQTHVLSSGARTLALSTAGAASAVLSMIASGVGHILTGFDHVLFLLALLLPLMLGRALPTRQLVREIAAVVTAFTVAHSITLGLAALGLVRASAAVIEPAIAASVALAALENVFPLFGGRRFAIAFALGLLHGFGFASALGDLGLDGSALVRALLTFNLGVELGQLSLVLLCLPLGLLIRRVTARQVWPLRAGSMAIAAVSVVWFVERVSGGWS